MKLNLGAGESQIPGFENLDRKNGQEVYPLAYADNSVDEIYASHILEHFSYREVASVLKDWVRVLKPGGVLRVAVPDFDKIVEWYKAGREDVPLFGYLLGGQTDANDYHKCAFNEEGLRADLEAAGLENITAWESEFGDCASLDVSLNLCGTKPVAIEQVDIPDSPVKIAAVASVPRLGFNATWHCTITALNLLSIPLTMVEGCFWQQCLTRGIEKALNDGADIIVTMDYDSIFDAKHIIKLAQLLADHPEFDIIVPRQTKRESSEMLFKMNGDRDFSKPLTRIATGHFGLTVFDKNVFARMPKPWFLDIPNAAGDWNDGRVDSDIFFWKQVEKAGLNVALANEVSIGHLELQIAWPDNQFQKVFQSLSEYREKGQPSICGGGLKVKLNS